MWDSVIVVRVLITGADGLLGRRMCQHLSLNHVVTGIVHRKVTNPVLGVNYVSHDLSTSLDCSKFPDSVEVVFHLAQSSYFRDFPSGAKDTFSVNVSSTVDLLEYARQAKVKKFFLASTGGVYGAVNTPITESSDLIPPTEIGFYFATKLASEMLSSSYKKLFDVTVVRFFFMYGPGQQFDRFLPALVHRVLNHQIVTLAGTDGILVNPIHVDDVSFLMGELLHRPSPSLINVSGPDIMSIRQIVEAIGDIVGISPIFQSTPSSEDVLASTSYIDEYFVNQKMMPFKDGLKSLVESILQQSN